MNKLSTPPIKNNKLKNLFANFEVQQNSIFFNIIVKFSNEKTERTIATIGDGSDYLHRTMWDILGTKSVEYVRIEKDIKNV